MFFLFLGQVMWVENEMGYAYLRAKHYGKALKKFRSVEKHFDDFVDDQFDFHSYCLRRTTLRSYVACLRMTDTLQV